MEPRRTVVLADDDPDIRDCAGELLRDEGFDVRVARDGQEALAIVGALGDGQCVLVLDLMMPGMSGYQVLDRLAREDRLAQLPVVVCSAFHRELDLPYRVHSVIKKPLDLDQLIEAVVAACRATTSEVLPLVGTPRVAGAR